MIQVRHHDDGYVISLGNSEDDGFLLSYQEWSETPYRVMVWAQASNIVHSGNFLSWLEAVAYLRCQCETLLPQCAGLIAEGHGVSANARWRFATAAEIERSGNPLTTVAFDRVLAKEPDLRMAFLARFL